MLYFIKKLSGILLKSIGFIFYDKKYIQGKYFDGGILGWKWILQGILFQKLLRINSHVPWPISTSTRVDEPTGITFDPNDIQNFMHFGCYYSNTKGGKIKIGKGTWIAPNVGIITTNHDSSDISNHKNPKNIIIGKNCWIGMNTVILPGVVLGENVIVGAGSVVTKSFLENKIIIAGNPAKIIKKIID